MTLQNLSKILDKYDKQLGVTEAKQLEPLKGLPFYSDWNKEDRRLLDKYRRKEIMNLPPSVLEDFNHAIGLPRKNGVEFPLFDYEQLLYNELQSHKHIWIKKATGLGVTEFMLRYMAWLCLKDSQMGISGSQMCIVTGPNMDLAKGLITRMKRLFLDKLGLTFDTAERVIELNGVSIEAYPSHHLDAMRTLTNPKFIFLDDTIYLHSSFL